MISQTAMQSIHTMCNVDLRCSCSEGDDIIMSFFFASFLSQNMCKYHVLIIEHLVLTEVFQTV